jgi:DNA topoisomerase-1
VLTLKLTKTKGAQKLCPQKDCGFSAPAEDHESSEPSSADAGGARNAVKPEPVA